MTRRPSAISPASEGRCLAREDAPETRAEEHIEHRNVTEMSCIGHRSRLNKEQGSTGHEAKSEARADEGRETRIADPVAGAGGPARPEQPQEQCRAEA